MYCMGPGKTDILARRAPHNATATLNCNITEYDAKEFEDLYGERLRGDKAPRSVPKTSFTASFTPQPDTPFTSIP
jgi:hypothetical protein